MAGTAHHIARRISFSTKHFGTHRPNQAPMQYDYIPATEEFIDLRTGTEMLQEMHSTPSPPRLAL